jgi:hypothetical protein
VSFLIEKSTLCARASPYNTIGMLTRVVALSTWRLRQSFMWTGTGMCRCVACVRSPLACCVRSLVIQSAEPMADSLCKVSGTGLVAGMPGTGVQDRGTTTTTLENHPNPSTEVPASTVHVYVRTYVHVLTIRTRVRTRVRTY